MIFKHIPKVLNLLYFKIVTFWCLNLWQVSQTAPLGSYRNEEKKGKSGSCSITSGRELPKIQAFPIMLLSCVFTVVFVPFTSISRSFFTLFQLDTLHTIAAFPYHTQFVPQWLLSPAQELALSEGQCGSRGTAGRGSRNPTHTTSLKTLLRTSTGPPDPPCAAGQNSRVWQNFLSLTLDCNYRWD